MGTPPAEERGATIKALGVDDVFGAGIRPQQLLHLQEMEAAQTDQLIVILSDVQLDKPLVGDSGAVETMAAVLVQNYRVNGQWRVNWLR